MRDGGSEGDIGGGLSRDRFAPPGPDMLPRHIELIGRDAELAELRAAAERRAYGRPIQISITGVAGVGKSAVGTELAHLLKHAYPDGALYVDLKEPVAYGDSSQVLRTFLE